MSGWQGLCCIRFLYSKGLNYLYFALKIALKDKGIYTRTYVWQGLCTRILYSKGLNDLYFALKGTVSRDFLLLVFFMNQFPPSP